nr:TetR/AcrR family transcriptional regulator [Dietzia aerolata]
MMRMVVELTVEDEAGPKGERMGAAAGEPVDETRERILDAAYDLFCTRGIRHSSMDEVARRAKSARITVYRKFETKDALVNEVMLREFQHYFERFSVEVRGCETVAERVEVAFASSLRAFAENPLLVNLLENERDSVVGSLIGRDGQMIATVRRFVAGRLAAEQRAGHLHAGHDVDLLAEMLVRVCASYLTIPTDLVDLTDIDALRGIARRFLVPMLEYRPD